jgi:hypothetical protein
VNPVPAGQKQSCQHIQWARKINGLLFLLLRVPADIWQTFMRVCCHQLGRKSRIFSLFIYKSNNDWKMSTLLYNFYGPVLILWQLLILE